MKFTGRVSAGIILLMAEILHQLIGSLSHYFTGFYTSHVVQDFIGACLYHCNSGEVGI